MTEELQMTDIVGLLVDEIALMEADGVHEFQMGTLDYESMKRLVVNSVTEMVLGILKDPDLTEEQKITSLITSTSYVSMQNFVLWAEKKYGQMA